MDDLNKKLNKVFIERLFEVSQNYSKYSKLFEEKKNSFLDINEKFNREQVNGDLSYFLKVLNNNSIELLLKEEVINLNILKKVLFELSQGVNWLETNEKIVVINYILKIASETSNFSLNNLLKLFGLLLAIPYAEKSQDLHGFLSNFIYEHIINYKNELQKLGVKSSYSPWQIPIPRLNSIFVKDEISIFLKKLDLNKSVDCVGKIILEQIGLEKDLDFIFSAYNHNELFSSEIAAIQIFLNYLRKFAIELLKSNLNKSEILELKESFLEKINDLHTPQNNEPDVDKFINSNERSLYLDAYETIFQDFIQISSIDKKELGKILENWTQINIDGSLGNDVYNSLNCFLNFFGYKTSLIKGIKEIKTKEKALDKILELLKIKKKIFLPPTFSNFKLIFGNNEIVKEILSKEYSTSSEFIDEIIKSILSISNSENKIKRLIENDIGKTLKHIDSKIHKEHIIYYFRRVFFNNPYNVNKYTNDAIKAFWSVFQRFKLHFIK